MPMQPLIVGIRLWILGSLPFQCNLVPQIKVGDRVIVETSRGKQLGEVVQIVKNPIPTPEAGSDRTHCHRRDLVLRRTWAQKEVERWYLPRAFRQLRLHGVKVVAAEYSFDGARLTFMFSTESEDKPISSPAARHAKTVPASRSRCTRSVRATWQKCWEEWCVWLESVFVPSFDRVQPDFDQDGERARHLPNAQELRYVRPLRCCLVYEYEQYAAARKELPSGISTWSLHGEGKVVDVFHF